MPLLLSLLAELWQNHLVGSVLFLAALTILCIWYKVAYAPFKYFRDRGINGPTPRAFFGNVLELAQDPTKFYREMAKKYGSVFGYYVGSTPVYVITNLDWAKTILANKFDHFTDRFPPSLVEKFLGALGGGPPDMFLMPVEQWRRTRHTISPTFSLKKLKQMSPLIVESCEALLDKMVAIASSQETADMKYVFGQFTMETILSTVFGQKMEILRGKADNDPLYMHACAFQDSMKSGTMVYGLLTVLSYLPDTKFINSLLKIILEYLLPDNFKKPGENIRAAAKSLVKARKEMRNINKVNDFMQMMINTCQVENEESTSCPLRSNSQNSPALTDDEMVVMVNLFLLVGHETTSNALAFVAYMLALNPNKQDKLCAEIDAYYEENKQASIYEAAHAIPYIEWVIHESLRLYPVGMMCNRYCNKACTVGDITIPKGALIEVPFGADTNHTSWENPDRFIPERFHPDIRNSLHPLIHKPFGWGPRSCIGMKFAMMETKMALVTIMRRIHFKMASKTEVPLQTSFAVAITATNGVHLKVVQRNSS